MPYPEIMIHGMRAELSRLGIEETKTSEAVAEAVEKTDGTVMVIVNWPVKPFVGVAVT